MKLARILLMLITLSMVTACAPKMSIFSGPQPLKEIHLQGDGEAKVLVIHIRGVINNSPSKGFLESKPGMVQQVVSRLKAAQEDNEIAAILLMIDSPGGGANASDIIYHEITRYKQKTGNAIVSLMMDTAASGGYYIAAPSDRIIAHPHTITGSIGVVFMRPEVSELLSKIGVKAVVTKSGKNKDMGSPFREQTVEEERLFQSMIDEMNSRFQGIVQKHRMLTPVQAETIADARVFTASDAKQIGLIDSIGYFDDAIKEVEDLTGIKDPQVIIYRDTEYPNDTAWNNADTAAPATMKMMDVGIAEYLTVPRTGFYYLWAPEY